MLQDVIKLEFSAGGNVLARGLSQSWLVEHVCVLGFIVQCVVLMVRVVQYSTVQYSIVQYTEQYSTVHRTVQYNTQNSTIQYCTV